MIKTQRTTKKRLRLTLKEQQQTKLSYDLVLTLTFFTRYHRHVALELGWDGEFLLKDGQQRPHGVAAAHDELGRDAALRLVRLLLWRLVGEAERTDVEVAVRGFLGKGLTCC